MTNTEALSELEHLRRDIETLFRLKLTIAKTPEERVDLTSFYDRRLTALAKAMDCVRRSEGP